MKKYANGILINIPGDKFEIAQAISELMNASEAEHLKMCEYSLKRWKEAFDADKNSKAFVEEIGKISNRKTEKIILITEGYPYGGERSFIENELMELVKLYDVSVIAITSEKQAKVNEHKVLELKERVRREQELTGYRHEFTVCHSEIKLRNVEYFTGLFKWIFSKNARMERHLIYKSGGSYFRRIWESAKYYSKATGFLKWIRENTLKEVAEGNTLIYTFWYIYTTLAFCILKNRYNDLRIITRAHGFDLYDEVFINGLRQPFKEYMDSYIDRIYFISEKGKEYYIGRNGMTADNGKYKVAYLGSQSPRGDLNVRVVENSNLFRIVSCSNIIPVKNLRLIIDALDVLLNEKPKKLVEWVHFGDGLQGPEIRGYADKKLKGKEGLTFKFMGRVDNDDIHRYYKTHQVDCFINSSISEGLPVSIMEAMSYGIPIVATDVGGIRELFCV